MKVFKNPKVAIISTGDELVEVGEQPLPYQIRRSNVYTLAPLLRHFNIQPNLFHLKDNKEEVTNSIAELVEKYDVLCLSGGVSKGKLDYVPDALEAVGVQKFFHKVKQRPGKPFWLLQSVGLVDFIELIVGKFPTHSQLSLTNPYDQPGIELS